MPDDAPPNTTLSALVLVGSVRPSPSESSSELLGRQILDALAELGVPGSSVRLADHNIKPGVATDMGGGDEWPAIRRQILDADILVIATPIWMGQTASTTKRVFERLDAELSEQNAQGLPSMYGKVAAVAVVGNEDGAHHVSSETMQALNDVGFTFAAGAATYWVGEAMQKIDYKDLEKTPDKVASTTKMLAVSAVHLARYLKSVPYPG